MSWSGPLVSSGSGTQSMPFLLAHTIFSQLEFEVTTDHYMSNITWKKVPIKQNILLFRPSWLPYTWKGRDEDHCWSPET